MTEPAAPSPDLTHSVPEGFKPLISGEEELFIGVNGPLFCRREDTKFILGMRVEKRHCNPWGHCHGGMLMTFIDMTLAVGANYQLKLGRFLPTINLNADYMAPAPKGCWIEGRMEVLRSTRTLVFAQCIVTADGVPAVRANGIFKIGAEFPALKVNAE